LVSLAKQGFSHDANALIFRSWCQDNWENTTTTVRLFVRALLTCRDTQLHNLLEALGSMFDIRDEYELNRIALCLDALCMQMKETSIAFMTQDVLEWLYARSNGNAIVQHWLINNREKWRSMLNWLERQIDSADRGRNYGHMDELVQLQGRLLALK
jgi:hypothetical protein